MNSVLQNPLFNNTHKAQPVMKTRFSHRVLALKGILLPPIFVAVNFSGVAHADYVYTTSDLPGASGGWASGISGTNIGGYYGDASCGFHGFLQRPCPSLALFPSLPQAWLV